MTSVAIIPAKGHSWRVPGKNYRLFHGAPMLSYPIRVAKDSGLFGSVIVSTDDEGVSEIAQQYGADVMIRSKEWCKDQYGPLDVARHCLSLMSDVEYVCVIYATAALMSVRDLHRGWKAVRHQGVAYSCSVGTVPLLHDAAQFFWCRAWALREREPEFGENTVLIPIAMERDCDVNTEEDWSRCERMYSELNRKAA